MSESNSHIDCRYCLDRHRARYLCDPGKKVLEALYAKGMEFNMPTIEFPEIAEPLPALGNVAGDIYMQQLVVQAGIVKDGSGIARPVVIFTGRSVTGPLPRWVYGGDDEQMIATRRLVSDITLMAQNGARKAREANR